MRLATKSTHGIDTKRPSGWQQHGQGDNNNENSCGSKIGDGIEIADAVKYLTQDTGQRGRAADPSSNPAMSGPDNWPRTTERTWKGFAPRATRIPISLVRCETAQDTSPAMPTHATAPGGVVEDFYAPFFRAMRWLALDVGASMGRTR